MRKRPTYTPEFKQRAAELVLDKGYSIAEVCQAVSVGPTALRRWVTQLQEWSSQLKAVEI